MCHYITAVLSATASIPELNNIALQHHRRFDPLANRSIELALLPGERYFLTTTGMCDCGTILGSSNRGVSRQKDFQVEAKRLRAKGWSQAKVTRWLEQKTGAAAERARTRNERAGPDLNDWLSLLNDVLQAGLTPYLGLLLHFY